MYVILKGSVSVRKLLTNYYGIVEDCYLKTLEDGV